jgi:outer membrane receptor protein involved in Fe transport
MDIWTIREVAHNARRLYLMGFRGQCESICATIIAIAAGVSSAHATGIACGSEHRVSRQRSRRLQAALAAFAVLLMSVAASAAENSVAPEFDIRIKAQPLCDGLQSLSDQTGLQFLCPTDNAASRAIRVNPVEGRYTLEESVSRMLDGTSVEWRIIGSYLSLKLPTDPPPPPPLNIMTADTTSAQIPLVLVEGSNSRDADIRRTTNDPEPYTVFDRRQIELSQAADLNAFLASRLPSLNSVGGGGGQADIMGASRQLDLHGMGSRHTLVLIDGRRMAGVSYGADQLQPDLSIIPLEAIERIEVLPTTASARYGGGATGGVINIVLRSNENGLRTSAEVERTAGTRAGVQHLFAGHGLSFAGGRGRLSTWASYSHQSSITTQDWDFETPGRLRIERNNPDLAAAFSLPPLSERTNVRSVDGSPLFDDTPGSYLFIPAGFDPTKDSPALLKQNAGRYSLALANSAQSQGGARSTIRGEAEVYSGSATTAYDFNRWLSADLDLRLAQTVRSGEVSGAEYGNFRGAFVPADAPTNPFGKDVWVTIPVEFGDGRITNRASFGRAAGAIQARLPHDWAARLEHTWSFSTLSLERPLLAVDPNAIADGRVNAFKDGVSQEELGAVQGTLRTTEVRTQINETALRLAGRAFATPAGDAAVTLLLERREERLAKGSAKDLLVTESGDAVPRDLLPEQRQRIESIYGELRLPLIATPRAPGRKLVEVQLSVRGDRYHADTALYDSTRPPVPDYLALSSSRFSAVSWMSSIRFQPLPSVFMRAHCGTGFLPPAVSDLTLPTQELVPSPSLVDPARANEPVGPVTVMAGGNPALEPERSRSCGGGIVVGVEDAPGVRLSVDYNRILKTGGIFSPVELLLSDPTTFLTQLPWRVTRAPVAPGDPYAVGRITTLDASSFNVSSAEVHAWDVGFGYRSPITRFGKLHFSTLVTLQPTFLSRLSAMSAEVNEAGVGLGPSQYKVSSSIELERGSWVFGWAGRYVPRYVVSRDPVIIENQGTRYVSAQQYHDVYASYALPIRSAEDATVTVQLGARNVFQHDPPFDAGALGYYSRHGEREVPTYYLMMRASF